MWHRHSCLCLILFLVAHAGLSNDFARKISPSAYRAAAAGHPFATVRLLFRDDVALAVAALPIAEAGGTVVRTLAYDFEGPHRLTARVPSTAVEKLAADDRVLGIYGPSLHVKADNAVAAQRSHVTPLYSAPYGLSGNGLALSLFELAEIDVAHPEFGGRVTAHFSGGSSSDALHATHVSGTMIAAGLNTAAKGMAPAATVHEFSALDDYAILLNNKHNALPALSVIADNNSWGYSLGWQRNQSGGPAEVWYGNEDLFGGYESLDSAPYDAMARQTSVVFVHSAGNDGTEGQAPLAGPWFPHAHVDDLLGEVLAGETFCYSQNGTGNDCPSPTCSAGLAHCEILHHPTYGPFGTMGLLASVKNVIAVGAVDQFLQIASFSSRGPTRDGRVKPDIVAKGVSQFSTIPNNNYRTLQGTSMSAPVITGMMALFAEQWKKTFNGQNPDPETLKVLLIAGADDLGNPGPDYTYGFGLADAQASVDLIIADNGNGSRIRSGELSVGQHIEAPIDLISAQNVRIVLGWVDPEILLPADQTGGKTLLNDLDLEVIDPNGNTLFPYVLDPANPNAVASQGVNTVDNVEEVEIRNAAAGTYQVVVTAKSIAAGPTQRYVLMIAPLAARETGDANGDGSVTVADVFFLINNLFAGGSAPVASVDVNGDGLVNVADVFYLINFLFSNGPAPR